MVSHNWGGPTKMVDDPSCWAKKRFCSTRNLSWKRVGFLTWLRLPCALHFNMNKGFHHFEKLSGVSFFEGTPFWVVLWQKPMQKPKGKPPFVGPVKRHTHIQADWMTVHFHALSAWAKQVPPDMFAGKTAQRKLQMKIEDPPEKSHIANLKMKADVTISFTSARLRHLLLPRINVMARWSFSLPTIMRLFAGGPKKTRGFPFVFPLNPNKHRQPPEHNSRNGAGYFKCPR